MRKKTKSLGDYFLGHFVAGVKPRVKPRVKIINNPNSNIFIFLYI